MGHLSWVTDLAFNRLGTNVEANFKMIYLLIGEDGHEHQIRLNHGHFNSQY